MLLTSRISRLLRIAVLAGCIPSFAPAQAADPPYISLEELRAKYADPAGKIAKIKGLDVYYKDEGQGPVLVMIHGSSSSLKTYDVIAAKLKDRYRIIRFDIPPMGLSGPVSDEDLKRVGPTDIPQGLLEYLGVKKVAACVGVSSGGTNCIYLSARNPGLVERLILSNSPSTRVEDAKPRPYPPLEKAGREAEAAKYKARSYWDPFFENFAGVPERITPQMRDAYYDYNRRAPDKNVIALAAKVADQDVARDLMNKITSPVLLLWGATDPLLTPPTADSLANYLPHADVSKLMLPDVGHYPPLEIPERYAQIVAAYVEAVTPVKAVSPNK